MTDERAFKAVFVTCRQVRDAVHFIFEVPSEKATEYLDLIGGFPRPGESRWCAIAQLKPLSEDTGQRGPSPHETSTRQVFGEQVPAGRKLSQLAGILATDPLYHAYINAPSVGPGIYAASYIRNRCGVTSRKDITHGTAAGELFLREYDAFAVWRDAPKHGAVA